jgi:hypothetical protein
MSLNGKSTLHKQPKEILQDLISAIEEVRLARVPNPEKWESAKHHANELCEAICQIGNKTQYQAESFDQAVQMFTAIEGALNLSRNVNNLARRVQEEKAKKSIEAVFYRYLAKDARANYYEAAALVMVRLSQFHAYYIDPVSSATGCQIVKEMYQKEDALHISHRFDSSSSSSSSANHSLPKQIGKILSSLTEAMDKNKWEVAENKVHQLFRTVCQMKDITTNEGETQTHKWDEWNKWFEWTQYLIDAIQKASTLSQIANQSEKTCQKLEDTEDKNMSNHRKDRQSTKAILIEAKTLVRFYLNKLHDCIDLIQVEQGNPKDTSNVYDLTEDQKKEINQEIANLRSYVTQARELAQSIVTVVHTVHAQKTSINLLSLILDHIHPIVKKLAKNIATWRPQEFGEEISPEQKAKIWVWANIGDVIDKIQSEVSISILDAVKTILDCIPRNPQSPHLSDIALQIQTLVENLSKKMSEHLFPMMQKAMEKIKPIPQNYDTP